MHQLFFGGRIKAVARQDALLQTHRSPPPQNKTTDTGQVDRYQREQAYDGTQMVCDGSRFGLQAGSSRDLKRALRKQG